MSATASRATDQLAPHLAKLNPEQLLAVQTIEGPVMVVAGPGTGKTQVLATRIAYILAHTDIQPHNILALSFTEAAVKNLRQRLLGMIGTTAYQVQLHTFHSFCADLIATHSEVFPIDRASQPLTELERYSWLEEIILATELPKLKPLNKPFHYLKDISRAISDLKREGVTVERFAELVTTFAEEVAASQDLKKTALQKLQTQLAKNQDLGLIFSQYQQLLLQRQRYDFDDMVTLVRDAWQQQPDFLAEVQETIQYCLVDEYQDTNSAQQQLLELWASFWQAEANLCVVGDPHQAIYRFQGASVENVLHFLDQFPTAQLITLTTGYRAPQPLYNAAAELIAHNTSVLAQPQLQTALNTVLTSAHATPPTQPTMVNWTAPDQVLEVSFVTEAITSLLKSGVPAKEIAILFRNNSDSLLISQSLKQAGILYDLDGGQNILHNYWVQQLLTLFQQLDAIKHGTDEALIYQVLQQPWFAQDQVTVLKLARATAKARISLWQALQDGYSYFQLATKNKELVTEIEYVPVAAAAQQLTSWVTKTTELPLPEWLQVVAEQSGFITWALQDPTKHHLVFAWQALHRLAVNLTRQRPAAQLADWLEQLATLERHQLSLLADDLNIADQAVHMSTVHKAKGREWQYVFVLHVIEGKWSNARERQSLPLVPGILQHQRPAAGHVLEDERRLFYVAITRAKKAVFVTQADTDITVDRSRSLSPSMFMTELSSFWQAPEQALIETLLAQAVPRVAALTATTPPPLDPEILQQAFFGQLTEHFSLSVSALNAYLRDPWQFVLYHLIKLPQPTSPVLVFGTAVHAALEKWGRQTMQGDQPVTLAQLQAVFADTLQQQHIPGMNFAQYLKHGQAVLAHYFEQELQAAAAPLFVERTFGQGQQRTVLGDITLKGRIDRVEWLDQAAGTVRVIDYKTGKIKTQGELVGQTLSAHLSAREQALPSSIRSPYQRQLLFYKLLTELDPTFKPTVVEGVFSFVEPDKKNQQIINRSLQLDDRAVAELKELIIVVMAEIRERRFLADLKT